MCSNSNVVLLHSVTELEYVAVLFCDNEYVAIFIIKDMIFHSVLMFALRAKHLQTRLESRLSYLEARLAVHSHLLVKRCVLHVENYVQCCLLH